MILISYFKFVTFLIVGIYQHLNDGSLLSYAGKFQVVAEGGSLKKVNSFVGQSWLSDLHEVTVLEYVAPRPHLLWQLKAEKTKKMEHKT